MNLEQLKTFLWQCTKYNFFFLLIYFVLSLFLKEIFYIHAHFYGGTFIEFKKDIYFIMGIHKLMWLFFNVIPYYVVRTMLKKD